MMQKNACHFTCSSFNLKIFYIKWKWKYKPIQKQKKREKHLHIPRTVNDTYSNFSIYVYKYVSNLYKCVCNFVL